MIPGTILSAIKTIMENLTTVTDGGPSRFKAATAGRALETSAFDKAFEVFADRGGTRGLTGIASKTWRYMRVVVRVVYFNEGRSVSDLGVLLAQDAQRLQEALCYLIRQLPTEGYAPGSVAALPGVETCTIVEDWELTIVNTEGGVGAYILTVPLRVEYYDDVSTA